MPHSNDSQLVTLDPTFEPITRAADPRATRAANVRGMAAPLAGLSGLRLGLLANGKVNSEELLDALCVELQRLAGVSVREIIRVCKASVSIPPSPRDMQRLVTGTDAVLVAVGD